MYTYIAHINVCMHVCVYIYIYIGYSYSYSYLSIYLSLSLSIYIYIYTYVCIFIRGLRRRPGLRGPRQAATAALREAGDATLYYDRR